jgi:hypothetical protein
MIELIAIAWVKIPPEKRGSEPTSQIVLCFAFCIRQICIPQLEDPCGAHAPFACVDQPKTGWTIGVDCRPCLTERTCNPTR